MEEQIQPPTQVENTTPMEPVVKQTKKGFPFKTLLLIVLLAVVAFGLSAYAVLKPQFGGSPQAQIPTITPIPNPIQTTLTVSSSPAKLSTPSAYSTNIVINTGLDMVNKVQLEISYDPNILSKVDITPGPFFTNPQVLLKNVDPVNGRISFALGVQDGEDGILGQGVVANLTFIATQKTASTSVSLLPKSEVTADGFSQSVLKTTIDGIFSLNITPKATQSSK